MNPRTFSVPPHYEARMESELVKRGYSLTKPRPLAEAVLKLSDHYTQNALGLSPWHEPWAQAASIAYYFPLNYARNLAVAQEAGRLGFFSELDAIADIGSGMGAALYAFQDTNSFKDSLALDVDVSSLELGRELKEQTTHRSLQVPASGILKAGSLPEASRLLLTASYVKTELARIPEWWFASEALAVVEPSTHDDARQLMRLRAELIQRGYKIWAPCTHQEDCPLLIHSVKDWCHDRIHWQAPSWWTEMERHLPMKNRTLTFPYLLARKTLPPPARLSSLARLTGDMLIEKGKTRQSFCRSQAREFLAWFPQRMAKDEVIHLERGSLIDYKTELEMKSSELRLKHPSDLTELKPDQRP